MSAPSATRDSGWMPPNGGGYCLTPGIWFGELPNPLCPPLDRLEDVVASRLVLGIGLVEIWREGLVWFDFTGTPLATLQGVSEPDGPGLLILLNQRAMYMTVHSSCVANAILQATNSIPTTGTPVTPQVQLMVRRGEPPFSNFRPHQEFCDNRFRYKHKSPFWETCRLAAGTRFAVPEAVGSLSLELFDALVHRAHADQLMNAIELTVRADANVRALDFSVAHMLAWTAIELSLDRLWTGWMERRAQDEGARRKHLMDSRTYTAAVRVEMLNVAGELEDELARDMHECRRDRNSFIHDGRAIRPPSASLAVQVAAKMLKVGFDYETPVTPSYGTYT